MIKADIFEEEFIRNEITKLATSLRHYKYVHNTYGPDEFDCCGYVWYVYNQVMGINVFNGGSGLSGTGKIWTGRYGNLTKFEKSEPIEYKLERIKPGDILLFHRQSLEETEPKPNNKYPGHCGIYLGDNRFIHCVTGNKYMVIINNFIKTPRWQEKLVASKDMITNNKCKKNVKL